MFNSLIVLRYNVCVGVGGGGGEGWREEEEGGWTPSGTYSMFGKVSTIGFIKIFLHQINVAWR